MGLLTPTKFVVVGFEEQTLVLLVAAYLRTLFFAHVVQRILVLVIEGLNHIEAETVDVVGSEALPDDGHHARRVHAVLRYVLPVQFGLLTNRLATDSTPVLRVVPQAGVKSSTNVGRVKTVRGYGRFLRGDGTVIILLHDDERSLGPYLTVEGLETPEVLRHRGQRVGGESTRDVVGGGQFGGHALKGTANLHQRTLTERLRG